MPPLFLTSSNQQKIAYRHMPGDGPGILFCGGFRSDMQSTKALALEDWCRARNIAFTRFDYRGHGLSEGEFTDFTIGGAISDALDIIDGVTTGAQIIVGSSMGGWVALQAALERKTAIRGMVGIAVAPDFTERLMYERMTPEQRQTLEEEGTLWVTSDYASSEYPITLNFIQEARRHLMLDDRIPLEIPVHLLHGQEDSDVPYETSLMVAKCLLSEDVTISLIKTGDHRLNRPEDLTQLCDAIHRLRGED